MTIFDKTIDDIHVCSQLVKQLAKLAKINTTNSTEFIVAREQLAFKFPELNFPDPTRVDDYNKALIDVIKRYDIK
jgi:hypothetical protein